MQRLIACNAFLSQVDTAELWKAFDMNGTGGVNCVEFAARMFAHVDAVDVYAAVSDNARRAVEADFSAECSVSLRSGGSAGGGAGGGVGGGAGGGATAPSGAGATGASFHTHKALAGSFYQQRQQRQRVVEQVGTRTAADVERTLSTSLAPPSPDSLYASSLEPSPEPGGLHLFSPPPAAAVPEAVLTTAPLAGTAAVGTSGTAADVAAADGSPPRLADLRWAERWMAAAERRQAEALAAHTAALEAKIASLERALTTALTSSAAAAGCGHGAAACSAAPGAVAGGVGGGGGGGGAYSGSESFMLERRGLAGFLGASFQKKERPPRRRRPKTNVLQRERTAAVLERGDDDAAPRPTFGASLMATNSAGPGLQVV